MAEDRNKLDAFAKMVQSISVAVGIVSVVVGIVISVSTFKDVRDKELHARELEILTRQLEARKPLLELRQKRYSETVSVAAVLADKDNHSLEEVSAARKRFRELYIAELSMVEAPEVEKAMIALAATVDPTLRAFDSAQDAAYKLSHALGDSFAEDWRIHLTPTP